MNVPHSFPLARPHHLSHMFLHRFILTSAAASAAASAAEQVFQPALAPAAAIFALGPFVPLGLHAFMPSFLLLVCMSQQFHAWSHMKKSELPEVVVALQVRPAVSLNLHCEFEFVDMLTAAAASSDACLVSAACSAFTPPPRHGLLTLMPAGHISCVISSSLLACCCCCLALHLPPQDAGVLIGRKQHGAHHKPNFEGNYSIVSGWWNPLLDNTQFFRWLEHRVVDATGVEPRCWYAPDHEWAEQVQPGQ